MREMSPPSQRIPPPCNRVRPINVTSRLVLPTPLRPSSARLSPSFSVNDTSSSTIDSPYPAVTLSNTSNSVMFRLPQINFLDARVRRNLRRRPFGQHLAAYQHRNAVGEAEHQAHIVFDE